MASSLLAQLSSSPPSLPPPISLHRRRFPSAAYSLLSRQSPPKFSSPFRFRVPRLPSLPSKPAGKRNGNGRREVRAVFERFTERAIKAVIFSQREAKSLGSDIVFTQHLLLGLVAEDAAGKEDGFLGSGITLDHARRAVREIWTDRIAGDYDSGRDVGSAVQVPFSISTKRVLEAAVEYSRSRGYNFIAPEHIALGLFSVDDGSAVRVLQRYV